jgi:prepilin-type processing-associated H-X9-DG protein
VRVLIALSLLGAIIVPASSARAAGPGGIGVRLVDVPADSRDDPLTGSYIVDLLAPGTSIQRRVEITNTTRSTAAVSVYAAAANLRQGNFAFADGHSPNELSSWTSVNRDVLRVLPATKELTTVIVNVPDTASAGERYAVVWAEVFAPAPAGGGVTLVNRVGVRMYVSIGTGGALPANFAIGSLNAERAKTGAPLVLAVVHNTGRRTLDISGNLTLTNGPGGLRAGPFPVRLSALAPDASESATVQLDQRLPRGPWRAELRLKSGFVERASAATITFPAQVVAPTPPAAETRSPIVTAIFLVLALLAVAAVAVLLSRQVPRGRGGGIGPAASVRD